MNPLSILRIEIVKRPIFNLLLIFLAALWWNLWWAIILLTLVIRLLLIKNSAKAMNMGSWMKDMQPKMQELQEKHKDDPQRLSEEMMKLRKTPWNNPFKGCLTMLIQIPVFLWLFYTVRDIAEWKLNTDPYSFLQNLPVDLTNLATNFYWMDLLTSNNLILTLIAAILMFVQMQMMTMIRWKQAAPQIPWMAGQPGAPDMWKMMWMMNYFMVLMIGWFVRSMPAWVWLYIATTTLFWLVQQIYTQWPLIKIKLWLMGSWKSWPEIIEP